MKNVSMKKFYTLALFIILVNICEAQSFGLKDLMEFSPNKAEKLTTHLLKKDYHRDYNDPDTRNLFLYQKEEKDRLISRRVQFGSALNQDYIVYATSCIDEKSELEKEIAKAGFQNYNPGRTAENFLQKDEYTLTISTEIMDSVPLYKYALVKTALPKASDIQYAEDLLLVTSHEFLSSLFGAHNVVKEAFQYSETEKSNCSILFPGTAKEAIFIWEDQQHYRGIELIVLGGSLNTATTQYLRLPHNQWRSKQGVHAGMPLKDLEILNGGPVSFYGWASEMAGTLVPTSSGNIDFKKLGVVLNCLNCDESATSKLPVVKSNAETDDRRIYVTTLILVPDKQKQVTALR
jgi:hypothetical protein